jgi:hypothetical protein
MADYNAHRIIMQVRDTVADGFASDSVNFHWGYQTFSLCYDSAGVVDTCMRPRVIVDTMNVDTFGLMGPTDIDGNSLENAVRRQVDTSFCDGFATQSRAVFPEWDCYYRVWVQGLTGMRIGSSPRIRVTIMRRISDPVKQR